MERRMLLGIVLSVLVIFAWSTLTGKCQPPKPIPPKDKPADGTPGTPGAPAPSDPPPPPPVDPDAAPEGATPPAEATVTLESDELSVVFTNRSAAVSSVTLRRAFEEDKKTPLDVVVPMDPTLLLGAIDTTALEPVDGSPGDANRREDPPGALRKAIWTLDEAAAAATPEKDVVYKYASASGRTWTKRWILTEGESRYDLRLEASVDGASAPVPVRLLASSGLLREHSTGATFTGGNDVALLRLQSMNEPTKGPFGISVTKIEAANRLAWLGARTHYFLAGWYDATGKGPQNLSRAWVTGEETSRREAMSKAVREWFRTARGRVDDAKLDERIRDGIPWTFHAWLVADVAKEPSSWAFYVGPISRRVLAEEPYTAVEPVIEYSGAVDFLAKGILWIFDRWLDLLGSIGVAVILMTLTVRGGLMPISIKNQLSMRRYGRKIQKIKPQLDALRKKYEANPRKLMEEQRKLQREHGIGFPTGCLMLFAQMFIFFALFSCLRAEYTFRNAPFLWIPDLSGPDRLIDLPFRFTIPIIGGAMGEIRSINLLPLVYVVLTIWQTKQMPKPVDEQQAQQMKMMKWLPIFFAVLLYNYTAALAVYMIVSTAIAIIESRLVKHLDEKELAVAR